MAGAREREQADVLRARFLTSAGNAVSRAVAGGATSVTVTFARAEPDTSYGVLATPNWDTTVRTGAKAVGSVVIEFGTAAPGGGGLVDVLTFRGGR